MDTSEFLACLKGKSPELLAALEDLRRELNLEKLYLIYINDFEAAWGYRSADDMETEILIQKLTQFIFNHTNEDFNGETGKILVLKNELEEIVYVTIRSLADIQYQGRPPVILYADDVKGEALIDELPVGYHKGLRHSLTHLLPWLKKVDFSNEAEEGALPSSGGLITITEKAARKIWEILQQRDLSASGGLRFRVGSGGCSGYQYEYAVEGAPAEDDEVIESSFRDGEVERVTRVFIDQNSTNFLRGTILDYGPLEDRGFAEDFIVRNPNARGGCGCGKSVSF